MWTQESPKGWVYIVSDGFDRNHPAVLYRAKPDTFTDRATWQGWGVDAQGKGAWGRPPTPLWGDHLGEMSMKLVDGQAVLSYFNQTWNTDSRDHAPYRVIEFAVNPLRAGVG
ncbi:putative secreted protein [Mycobacteroides abscessus subsp. abscessus]|nr:putative secreted protein [Mycobacteroides abscessus subsp. abscessus]